MEDFPCLAASRHWEGHLRRGQQSGEDWSSHSGKQIPFCTDEKLAVLKFDAPTVAMNRSGRQIPF